MAKDTPLASFENPRYSGSRDVARVGLVGSKHEVLASTAATIATVLADTKVTAHPALHMQPTNQVIECDTHKTAFHGSVPGLDAAIIEGKKHLEVQQTAATTFFTRGGGVN